MAESSVDLRGHLAVVTGAASGIGKAIAERCCLEGVNVALVDINNDRLQQLTQTLSSQYPKLSIKPFICDCSDRTDILQLVTHIKTTFRTNSIQMLFNNVGIASLTSVLDANGVNKLQKQMNVNVWSIIYLTQSFLPLLLTPDNDNKQCFIVQTGSLASIMTASSFYWVTKHTVLALSEAFERDLRHYFAVKSAEDKNVQRNVWVTTLCPSVVNTSIRETSDKIMMNNASNSDNNDISVLGVRIPGSFPTQDTLAGGIDASEVAEMLFAGLKKKQFLVYTHDDMAQVIIEDKYEALKNQTYNEMPRLMKALQDGESQRRLQSKL